MYHKEYESLIKELNRLQSIPDAYKDDDIREDIKSIFVLLSQNAPDNCVDGSCEF